MQCFSLIYSLMYYILHSAHGVLHTRMYITTGKFVIKNPFLDVFIETGAVRANVKQ